MKYENFLDGPKYRRLTLTPGGGTDISNCIREAIIICLTKDCTVIFSHNGVDIEIDPYGFIDPVYGFWKEKRDKG